MSVSHAPPWRVAVLSMEPVGHLNPMLALAEELGSRQRDVLARVFCVSRHAEKFRRAGCQVDTVCSRRSARTSAHAELPQLVSRSFVEPQEELPDWVDAVRGFAPDLVMHDVFDLRGVVAAEALRVPRVAVMPLAGVRALGPEFVSTNAVINGPVARVNEQILAKFGVDILGREAAIPVFFPSPWLTLMTAIADQEPGFGEGAVDTAPTRDAGWVALERLRNTVERSVEWVGPCVPSLDYVGSGPPASELTDPPAPKGTTTILFSPGTNITTFRKSTPVGGVSTGAMFVDAAIGALLDAFAGRADTRVLLALGEHESTQTIWPINFQVLHHMVRQRELLANNVDVFMTHHGLNSTAESILARVPMISYPGYGDQIANARFCVEAGVARCPWELGSAARSVSGPGLLAAMDDLVGSSQVRKSLESVRRCLVEGGGPSHAVDLVVSLLDSGATWPATPDR